MEIRLLRAIFFWNLIYQSARQSVSILISVSVILLVCQSVSISVYQPVSESACEWVSVPVSRSVYQSAMEFVSECISEYVSQSVWESVSVVVSVSVSQCVCEWVCQSINHSVCQTGNHTGVNHEVLVCKSTIIISLIKELHQMHHRSLKWNLLRYQSHDTHPIIAAVDN